MVNHLRCPAGISLSLLILGLVAMPAFGRQDSSSETEVKESVQELVKETPPNLLAGPRVPREARGLVPGAMRGGDRRGRLQVMPLRVWLQALRDQDLTEKQAGQITAIMDEFRKAQKTFRTEHGERRRELEQELRALRKQEKRPSLEQRREMQEIRSHAPKPREFQKKAWAVLTAEQQDSLKKVLGKKREESKRRKARRDRKVLKNTDLRQDQRVKFLRSRQQAEEGSEQK